MFESVTPRRRAAASDRNNGHTTRGNVLVVEDDPDFRELLKFLLTRLGYTVLEAADGNEALQLARTRQLDLIVTDLGLPGIDGLEFIRRVRALKRDQKNLTIVVLTAYDGVDKAGSGLDRGYDFLLSKPVDLDQIVSLIEALEYRSQSKSAKIGTPPYANERRQKTFHAVQGAM